MLSDEFRVHHRAASESLIRAASYEVHSRVIEELDQAIFFEGEAMKHVKTTRQRALGIGLLHAIDLMRVAADAEFLTD